RRDRDRVPGMDAHRVEVLDRAHDDDVVEPVADDLELELVPPTYRLLVEHLADRRFEEPALHLPLEGLPRIREAAAVAAECERGPDYGRKRQVDDVLAGGDDSRGRHVQA